MQVRSYVWKEFTYKLCPISASMWYALKTPYIVFSNCFTHVIHGPLARVTKSYVGYVKQELRNISNVINVINVELSDC